MGNGHTMSEAMARELRPKSVETLIKRLSEMKLKTMNAEELLKYLKKCVEELEEDTEVLVTATMYNPTELQNDVSFLIMENVKNGDEIIGTFPRFKINVSDLEAIRKIKK